MLVKNIFFRFKIQVKRTPGYPGFFCNLGDGNVVEVLFCHQAEEGFCEDETRAVKEAVKIPAIGGSNIKSPSAAENLLQSGACDFVGVGRQHIADPEWIRKTKEARTEEIAHCIGCLYCFESLLTVGYVRCSVNPKAGREAVFHEEMKKDGNGRKVSVVGGGVAGMKASAVLGERGFDVTLYEKEDKFGGEVNPASATAPYKDKVGWIVTTNTVQGNGKGRCKGTAEYGSNTGTCQSTESGSSIPRFRRKADRSSSSRY